MNNETIWRIFSVEQELNPDYRDKYDRFPLKLNKHNANEPVVSHYLFNSGFKPVYPEGKTMAVCISHDIDLLVNDKWALKTTLNQQVKALIKGDFPKVKKNNAYLKRHINPNYSVKKLVDYLKEKNICSTMYFMALSENDQDFNYRLEEVKEEIEYALNNGFEIGLHGGHLAYNNLEKVLSEKQKLEQVVNFEVGGYRNHYLKFIYPKTLENLVESNFLYDSTLGFAEQIGFRNGMCYPFFPYNKSTDNYMDIYELPLLAMDDTLYKYMGLNHEQAFNAIVDLSSKVKNVGGVFTLLWHNNLFSGEKGKVFKKAIEYLEKQNVWFATSSEIINWYKDQNYFEEIRSKMESLRKN